MNEHTGSEGNWFDSRVAPRLSRDYQFELDSVNTQLKNGGYGESGFAHAVRKRIENQLDLADAMPDNLKRRRAQVFWSGAMTVAASFGLLLISLLYPTGPAVPKYGSLSTIANFKTHLNSRRRGQPITREQLARSAHAGIQLLELGITGAVWTTPDSEMAVRHLLGDWPGLSVLPNERRQQEKAFPEFFSREPHLVTNLARNLLGYR